MKRFLLFLLYSCLIFLVAYLITLPLHLLIESNILVQICKLCVFILLEPKAIMAAFISEEKIALYAYYSTFRSALFFLYFGHSPGLSAEEKPATLSGKMTKDQKINQNNKIIQEKMIRKNKILKQQKKNFDYSFNHFFTKKMIGNSETFYCTNTMRNGLTICAYFALETKHPGNIILPNKTIGAIRISHCNGEKLTPEWVFPVKSQNKQGAISFCMEKRTIEKNDTIFTITYLSEKQAMALTLPIKNLNLIKEKTESLINKYMDLAFYYELDGNLANYCYKGLILEDIQCSFEPLVLVSESPSLIPVNHKIGEIHIQYLYEKKIIPIFSEEAGLLTIFVQKRKFLNSNDILFQMDYSPLRIEHFKKNILPKTMH